MPFLLGYCEHQMENRADNAQLPPPNSYSFHLDSPFSLQWPFLNITSFSHTLPFLIFHDAGRQTSLTPLLMRKQRLTEADTTARAGEYVLQSINL